MHRDRVGLILLIRLNTSTQRKRTTEKHLEKRFGEGNVHSGLQVQLDEDGDEWSVVYDTLRVMRRIS